MEAVAKLRNCPMSARKMRLVVDNIRGRNVVDALNILRYTKKEASIWLEKLLLSAIANWEYKNNNIADADEYDLYIKTIFSNDGAMLKRF
ncbi:MAG TPA: 50S ribosomal protein L22, partial [Phaeodactylibacter sp.]|nr:50S ribosomal protein L22 [Phaeodactylibacter sp.]